MTVRQVATVWLMHADGRVAAVEHFGLPGVEDLDVETAWAYAHSLSPRGPERREATGWFTPVEINIDPREVPLAIAKWETVAGHRGVCHVETRAREPWVTRLNTVHALPA
jgi:hypothetical protein